MSVKIRLKRTGRRHQPSYRMVVIDGKKPQDSKVLAKLGFYDPLGDQLEVDTGRALSWLKKGAKPSKTARDLLSKIGVMEELHKSRH